MNLDKKVAKNIRDLIAAKYDRQCDFHMAIEELGLEVHRSTVSRWAAGERVPNLCDWPIIAKALGLRSIREILPK